MNKSREWWDAELDRIILEHYRKGYREWWAKQCIDNECHASLPCTAALKSAQPSDLAKLPTKPGN